MLFHTKKNNSFAYLWFSNTVMNSEMRRKIPQWDIFKVYPGLDPSLIPLLCRITLCLQWNGKSKRKLNVQNSGDVLSVVEVGEVEEMLTWFRKTKCNAWLLKSILGLDCFSILDSRNCIQIKFRCLFNKALWPWWLLGLWGWGRNNSGGRKKKETRVLVILKHAYFIWDEIWAPPALAACWNLH